MTPSHEDPDFFAFLRGAPDEQLRWLTTRGLPPATLLAVHNACAQRCFFCAGPGTVTVPEAERTRLDTALAHLAARPPGVDRLLIGGNEPTLHPAFDTLLPAALPAGFRTIELMTNGARLAADAPRWRAAGVTEVVVPLYGATAPLHDGVVGVAAFDTVVAGLNAAFAAGIRVSVHTLLLRRTLAGLGELSAFVRARWGTRLGAALVREKPVFEFGTEAPAFETISATLLAIPAEHRPLGLATPRCLPLVDEPPPLVAELYFRSQRRVFSAPCGPCAARSCCGGLVAAYASQARPDQAQTAAG